MLDGPKINVGSLAESAVHERRRDVRYPFTSAVEVVVRETQTRIQGRTSDLSRGGCYLDTANSFPAGSIVMIRLTKDNCTFEADAEVLSKFCEKVLDVSKCAVEEKRRCWRFPKVTSINV